MQVLIDQVCNETQTVTVNTAGGSLDLSVFVNQTVESEIRIMVSTLEVQVSLSRKSDTIIPLPFILISVF